jgi:DNA-binding NtrC family response regulator
MISREEIDKIPLFHGISSETAKSIADHFSLRIFLRGEHIYLRGEPGNSMFVILKGKVVATLTNAEGSDYTISTLREGGFFGELGLLAGEPRSEHAKAITEVLAAEIDQEAYRAFTRSFPEFNARLMQLLAKRVVKAKVQWQGDQVNSVKGVSRSLLSQREPMAEDRFPGVTKWAGEMNGLIEEIASSDSNVLIIGEPGTESVFVAQLIVSRGVWNTLPFLSLNCSNPSPGAKVTSEAGGKDGNLSVIEDAQESGLFGHEPGSTLYARGWRRGYIDIADTGTLVLHDVDRLAPKVQDLLLRYLQTRCFSRIGSNKKRKSKVRIIATTARDMDVMVEQGRFNGELLELLRRRVVRLIPLRERRKDIPAVAQYFLTKYRRKNREPLNGFSKEAMKALVGHGWPLNIAELKQALDRAVAVCQGNTIEEEHIFLDIRSSFPPAKINLLRIEKISRFLRHKLVPGVLQFITVPFFLLLIFYTLFGPKEQNLGNVVSWSLLWPLLLLSIVLSGRGFCAYCPFSAISSAFVYRRKTFLSFPAVMKKHGIWVGIAAFVSIFWIEHVTEAFLNARVTGIVFLSISGSAIITALLFGKRIWCLHICPLGRMLGEFATLSITELRGNSEVCVNQCETQACLKERTCPMGLHPSAERTSHDCILCFACVRKCMQKSVHLDVLLPHQKILARKSWEFSRSTFAVLLVGSVLASQALTWLGGHKAFTPSIHHGSHWESFLVLFVITIGFAVLTFMASGTRKFTAWRQNFIYAGSAYLPLAFFGFFNIYFRQFISQGNEIPRLLMKALGFRGFVSAPQITPNLVVLHALPPVFILTGCALSLYLLRKLCDQYALQPRSYRLHQVIISVVCFTFLIIL